MAEWSITRASPMGGSVFGDVLLTLTGHGFDKLQRVQYNPRKTQVSIWAISATRAQTYLPCSKMGLGLHTMLVRLFTGEVQTVGTGDGLKFVCHSSLQSDGLIPFAGPSWPGLAVEVTVSNQLMRCTQPERWFYKCMPPPYTAIDKALYLNDNTGVSGAPTIETARCRFVGPLVRSWRRGTGAGLRGRATRGEV